MITLTSLIHAPAAATISLRTIAMLRRIASAAAALLNVLRDCNTALHEMPVALGAAAAMHCLVPHAGPHDVPPHERRTPARRRDQRRADLICASVESAIPAATSATPAHTAGG
jgi:hypothetical protein